MHFNSLTGTVVDGALILKDEGHFHRAWKLPIFLPFLTLVGTIKENAES